MSEEAVTKRKQCLEKDFFKDIDGSSFEEAEWVLLSEEITAFLQGLARVDVHLLDRESSWPGMGINWKERDDQHCGLEVHAFWGPHASVILPSTLLVRVARPLLSVIAKATANVDELDVDEFQSSIDCAPSIEDVFYALAKEERSSWRTKKLRKLVVTRCDMNARGDPFHLGEDDDSNACKYPTGLEEVHVCYPHGRVESATIFRVASRSPGLRKLSAGAHMECIAMDFTSGAVDAFCDVLSRKTALFETHWLPYNEIYKMPEPSFQKLLAAASSRVQVPRLTPWKSAQGAGTPRLDRCNQLGFYMRINQYMNLLRDCGNHFAPLAFAGCQRNCQWSSSMKLYALVRTVLPDLLSYDIVSSPALPPTVEERTIGS